MKNYLIRVIFLGVLFMGLFIFGSTKIGAQTLEYDLGITSEDIFFSNSILISGQPVRIYAVVRNHGTRDVIGYALFYAGPNLIGESQVVSVRAGGYNDEVFVDWIIPEGSFNIRVDIKGQSPKDENPANDRAVTALFYPKKDADSDGVIDENDNCPNNSNPDQGDVDGDGLGDVCDSDDDNDGLPDNKEGVLKTSPVDPDTDDDSILDGQDNCPLVANPDQKDKDRDGLGDACDSIDNRIISSPSSQSSHLSSPDQDGDGILDSRDNCRTVANPSQTDTDKDGIGDLCDIDDDNDGLGDQEEKRFGINPQNPDSDGDKVNDKEDSEPLNSNIGRKEIVTGKNVTREGEEDIIEDINNLISEVFRNRDQKELLNVVIGFVKINSNTYLFKAGVADSLGDLKYEWNFGDGTKSTQKEIKHTFQKSGTYKVVLKVSDRAGNSKEVETEIKARSFNYPFLFAGILFGLLLGGAIWHRRKKRGAMLKEVE